MWSCVCVCIHSVAMWYWEDALVITHITFTHKASLLSGQNMEDTLPKVAVSLLANSKNNAIGYFIIAIRAVSCDFLSFLDLFAFFSTWKVLLLFDPIFNKWLFTYGIFVIKTCFSGNYFLFVHFWYCMLYSKTGQGLSPKGRWYWLFKIGILIPHWIQVCENPLPTINLYLYSLEYSKRKTFLHEKMCPDRERKGCMFYGKWNSSSVYHLQTFLAQLP